MPSLTTSAPRFAGLHIVGSLASNSVDLILTAEPDAPRGEVTMNGKFWGHSKKVQELSEALAQGRILAPPKTHLYEIVEEVAEMPQYKAAASKIGLITGDFFIPHRNSLVATVTGGDCEMNSDTLIFTRKLPSRNIPINAKPSTAETSNPFATKKKVGSDDWN